MDLMSKRPLMSGLDLCCRVLDMQLSILEPGTEDLYKKMVVAGSRARARGQHSLKAAALPALLDCDEFQLLDEFTANYKLNIFK